jgi:hypothetical protein
MQLELEGDIESDALLDRLANEEESGLAISSLLDAPSQVPLTNEDQAAVKADMILDALTLKIEALQVKLQRVEEAKQDPAQWESEVALRNRLLLEKAGKMEDLLASLDGRASVALEGGSREAMLRARAVQGRGQDRGGVPPQRLRTQRAGLAGFSRREAESGRTFDSGRDVRSSRRERHWAFSDEQKEEEELMGRQFDGLAIAGTQMGMDHPMLPQWMFNQMQPNAHAYAMRNTFSKYRQKEMCMLGLAVHRLDREGSRPTAGSGMAVLLRRMAALDALERGQAGEVADAIEEPGALLTLYPQLALSQATVIAEKRRRLQSKADKLKPDAASKSRRDP